MKKKISNNPIKPIFALVTPRFEDVFHSYYAGEIIKGVALAASRLNADFFVHIVDRSNREQWLDSILATQNVLNGIIFADIDNDDRVVAGALQKGIPSIVLNNFLNSPINYIAIDNRQAAFDVVDYLVDRGHHKIATVAGDMSTQSGLKRLEGYREALIKHQLKAPREYVAFGDYLRTPARQAAEQLLSLDDRPTAIFAASDVMAFEVIDVAREKGLKVPEDLSVIGFDNNPLSYSGSIRLTTVEQPLVEMGRLGLETLNKVTQGQEVLPAKKVLLTNLIERETVRKIS